MRFSRPDDFDCRLDRLRSPAERPARLAPTLAADLGGGWHSR